MFNDKQISYLIKQTKQELRQLIGVKKNLKRYTEQCHNYASDKYPLIADRYCEDSKLLVNTKSRIKILKQIQKILKGERNERRI